MTSQYVWQNISDNQRPQEPSAEQLYPITPKQWDSPAAGGINMYCTTKAASTEVIPTAEFVPLECKSICQGRVENDAEQRWGEVFRTYRWGSPRRWSLWLQGGRAGTAYTLRMWGKKMQNEQSQSCIKALWMLMEWLRAARCKKIALRCQTV